MIKLYQFAISHYCEKVRWALDYKNLDHELINLLPGFHIKAIRKNHKYSSVPVLVDKNVNIQGSSKIITYLDEKYPQNSLTPEDDTEKERALYWEKYLDENLGAEVRLCCYHIMLEYPKLVIPFFIHKGPWYGRFLIPMFFSKIRQKMRFFMKINSENFEASKAKMHKVIDELNKQLQKTKYLAGDQFTRADLTAASLLAPLRMPDGYGLSWPDQIPTDLQNFFSEFEDKIQWVDDLYKMHRNKK